MEVSGKIIAKLPLQSGVAKATGREWKKQEYVLETHDTYPRKVKFDFFGERVDSNNLEIGDEVTISFDIESREFNGRWYTDIRAWRSEKGAGAAPQQPAPMQGAAPTSPFDAQAAAPIAPDFGSAENASDDLPF